jgi:hypothetical protein
MTPNISSPGDNAIRIQMDHFHESRSFQRPQIVFMVRDCDAPICSKPEYSAVRDFSNIKQMWNKLEYSKNIKSSQNWPPAA